MKKAIKKVVSILLVCMTVFSVVPMAIAAEEEPQYPQLTVKGFGASCVKIYYEDDPEQKSLFYPFEEDRFTENLDNIGDYIFESVENNEPNVLKTVIYNYLMDTLGMLAFKPDGSNMDGVVTEPVGLRNKGNGRYEFYYDCRESPAVSADYLHDCVQQLLAETGAEKIELIGSSFGANIVTSYMYKYKEDLAKVDTLLLCAPSVGGMHFLGQLLSGDFNISAVGLCDFLSHMSEEQLLPDFLYILEEAGLLEIFLSALAVPVLREAVYEAVVEVARDFLATLPTLWVCVPDEYFETAMEYMYGENYRSPDHTYAKVISEMTYYHYEIANKAAEIYLEAESENEQLDVAIVCKFGTAAIPLFSGENTMDDGLVTLPVSSFGATCTTYGEKLPADYKQQKYTEYNFMSPEWNIDASTGVLPFRTWYIKGLGHGKKIGDYNRFIEEIVRKDMDVFTDSNRPQYLAVSEEDPQMLVPLASQIQEEEETLFEKFLYVIRKLMFIPRMIFEWLLEGKEIPFGKKF